MINNRYADEKGRLRPGQIYDLTEVAPPSGRFSSPGLARSSGGLVADPDRARPGDRNFEPGQEPVRGYRLIRKVGVGRTGQVWKAAGPGGFPVALRLVAKRRPGVGPLDRAISRMRQVRHANLLTTFGVWEIPGFLVVGMDLADGTVVDRFEAAIGGGLPGIPFVELSAYLEQAARGADHLDRALRDERATDGDRGRRAIKPQDLLLVGDSLKLGGFGWWGLDVEDSGYRGANGIAPTPSPSVAAGGRTFPASVPSAQADLARIYCLLGGNDGGLTGNPRAARDLPGDVDLSKLPAPQRPVVARALAPDPADRWPDCLAFVQELIRAESAARPAQVAASKADPGPSRPSPSQSGRRARASRAWARCVGSIVWIALLGVAAARLQPTEGGQVARGAIGPAGSSAPHPGRVPLPIIPSRAHLAPVDTSGRPKPGPGSIEPILGVEDSPSPWPGVLDRTFRILDRSFARVADDPSIRKQLEALGPSGSPPAGSVDALLHASIDADRAETSSRGPANAPAVPQDVAGTSGSVIPGSPVADPPASIPRTTPGRPDTPGDRVRNEKPAHRVPGFGAPGVSVTLTPKEPMAATSTIRLPDANAESVVRGDVGRENPDEWYGPIRIIHSPPLLDDKHYLVGSFWTDGSGRQQARTHESKVHPGRADEVDLRPSKPTSKVMDRSRHILHTSGNDAP